MSLREVADLMGVGVIVGDEDGAAGFANKAWMEMTGQPDLAWIGSGWLRVLPVRELDRERVAIAAALARGETRKVVWRVTHPTGREMTLAVTITPATDDGMSFGFVATTVDVTAHEARARTLVHQATHDPLTGLLNRMEIHALVSHALKRRRRASGPRLALLFIDVDDLKGTNDRLGHDAGDHLLQTLAMRIREAVRPVDAVARYGGDEFVVLCDDITGRDEARSIAERIIERADAPDRAGDPARVSIGIAFADEPETTPEQLIGAADLAMYEAKKSGGRRHHMAGHMPAVRLSFPMRTRS